MIKDRLAMRIAASALIGVLALASCGEDDGYSGPPIVGPRPGSKVTSIDIDYKVDLADPNVCEAADVVVQYLDASGNTKQETVTADWTKSITLAAGSKMRYGMMVRMFAKESPALTKDSYDFTVKLSAPIYNVWSDGTRVFTANVKPYDFTGLLSETDKVRTREQVLSETGKMEINAAGASFCITEVKDSASRKENFVWQPIPAN